MTAGRPEIRPCGTAAASRNHYRRGEKPCQECLAANRQRKAAEDGHMPNAHTADLRKRRNGLPEFVPYLYGIPRPASSLAALGRAAALYGWPDDEEEAS